MRKIVSKLIQRLGRKSYIIDPTVSNYHIFFILWARLFQMIRGFWIKQFFLKSNGILFVGINSKIRFRNKISVGKTVFFGDYVEINALSKRGVLIGNNVSILKGTIIECTGVIRDLGEGLIIGNNVGIAQNCFIQVRGMVEIGNNVILGPGVSIFSENHNFSDPNKYINEQGETRKGVVIKNGVWIGSNVTILDGVTIGAHCIIAAGSVVNKNLPEYTIAGGVPAKVLKNRINTL